MAIKEGKVRVVTILDKELKDKLEILAKRDKRSLSNYICLLLEKHVEDNKIEEDC